MITTADFPQADRLQQVGQVTMAIANGQFSDSEIEAFIGLTSDGRQGRYYRKAAEILGLISNDQNVAVLTVRGQEYSSLQNEISKTDFLAQSLVETPIFKKALEYISRNQPTSDQLRAWFISIYPGESSTAARRYSTFVSYLRDAGLAYISGESVEVRKYIGSILKQESEAKSKLIGKNLAEFPNHSPKSGTEDFITSQIDAQKLERANMTHWKLVDAKSTFLTEKNVVPFDNKNVDLFAGANGQKILYEMKSVNKEGSNFLPQVRKAVSQLYEYRYIYNEPDAALCIVTNCKIKQEESWLLDYLARDRLIAYEWTSDFKSFECDAKSSEILQFFAP
jgi:hypothetical protein